MENFLEANQTSCKNSSVNCTSTSLKPQTKLSGFEVIEIFMSCLVFVLGAPGNIYVIHKFTFTSKKYYSGAKFVVSLAAVDFLASFILPVLDIYDTINTVRYQGMPVWHLGKVLCYVLQNTHAIFLGASSWCLVAIACARLR